MIDFRRHCGVTRPVMRSIYDLLMAVISAIANIDDPLLGYSHLFIVVCFKFFTILLVLSMFKVRLITQFMENKATLKAKSARS